MGCVPHSLPAAAKCYQYRGTVSCTGTREVYRDELELAVSTDWQGLPEVDTTEYKDLDFLELQCRLLDIEAEVKNISDKLGAIDLKQFYDIRIKTSEERLNASGEQCAIASQVCEILFKPDGIPRMIKEVVQQSIPGVLDTALKDTMLPRLTELVKEQLATEQNARQDVQSHVPLRFPRTSGVVPAFGDLDSVGYASVPVLVDGLLKKSEWNGLIGTIDGNSVMEEYQTNQYQTFMSCRPWQV